MVGQLSVRLYRIVAEIQAIMGIWEMIESELRCGLYPESGSTLLTGV